MTSSAADRFIALYLREPTVSRITCFAIPACSSIVFWISSWMIAKNRSDIGPVSRLSMIAAGVTISLASSAP